MKKTRLTKHLISLGLVFLLSINSFAAVVADNDGSAFITKAEFDSALADFNARLTTFEAGINSKIDSQVTSYLDRNGIWNGKFQHLLIDNNDASERFPDRRFYWKNSTAKTGNMNQAPQEYVECFPYNKQLAICDKAGLIYLSFDFLGDTSTTSNPADRRISFNIKNSGNVGSIITIGSFEAGVGTMATTYRIMENTGHVNGQVDSLKIVRWSAEVMHQSVYGDILRLNYAKTTSYSCFYFVDKFDPVWLRFHLLVVTGGQSFTWDSGSSAFWNGATDETRPTIHINTIAIY